MFFKKGLIEGAIGGHGPIKYSIQKYTPGDLIEFKFMKPDGFKGIHKFEITEIGKDKTELKHTINMVVSGKGILTWHIAIKATLQNCYLSRLRRHEKNKNAHISLICCAFYFSCSSESALTCIQTRYLIFQGTLKWLHNALIEDCMDKAENHFLTDKKKTKWSFWVMFLRRLLKKKKRNG